MKKLLSLVMTGVLVLVLNSLLLGVALGEYANVLKKKDQTAAKTGLALLIGGGVSNLIDRFRRGYTNRLSQAISARSRQPIPMPSYSGIMSCTTLLVGKSATIDGSTMIARNDDSGSGRYDPKRFIAVNPCDQPRHYRSELSHIANHIDRIAQQLPTTRVRKAFEAFFKAYLIEIELHFTDEEQNVYPCILALQQGQRGKGRINDFIALHGNLQDKLDDLTQIIFKYLPASVTGDDPIDAVLDILQLSQDLKKHNLIEEKIMIPYVKWIEKKVK